MSQVNDICQEIQRLPVEQITSIVRKAAGNDRAEPSAGWTATSLAASSVGAGTIGFIKVKGGFRAGGETGSWSSVIKVVDATDDRRFDSPKRELEAYRSGFFDSLEGNFQAAPCHGITDREDGTAWIWLHDLSAAKAPPWTAEEFIAAAHHLGQFNGSWPETRAPEGSWLARHGESVKPYYVVNGPFFQDSVDALRDHEIGRRASAKLGLDNFLALPDRLRVIVEASKQLPRVVSHNDCHARNLFLDQTASGDPVTYAVDWASVGLAPIGLDGGTLAGGPLLWRAEEVNLAAEIEPDIFDSYRSGLMDAGLRPIQDDLRLGYLTNYSVYVVGSVWQVASFVIDTPGARKVAATLKERTGLTDDEFIDHTADRLAMFAPLVEEALELAEAL